VTLWPNITQIPIEFFFTATHFSVGPFEIYKKSTAIELMERGKIAFIFWLANAMINSRFFCNISAMEHPIAAKKSV